MSLSTLYIPIIAQAVPEAEQLTEAFELLNFGRVTQALFIFLTAYLINRFLAAGLERMGEGQAKRRLIFKKVSSFARIAIFSVAIYLMVMTVLKGKESLLVGFLATVGFALGFALKDTASSLMAGVMILVDQPFQVGDTVLFGDIYGEVVEIGLRSVRIITPEDHLVSIPNNKFLTDAVASANAGELDMKVCMDFYIALAGDFELANRIIYEAMVTSRYVYLKKPVVVETREVHYGRWFSTHLIARAYILDARYEEDYLTDITERVKRKFFEHQIEYPSDFRGYPEGFRGFAPPGELETEFTPAAPETAIPLELGEPVES